MLLARLQREAIARAALGIGRLADETAGHQAGQSVGDCAIGGMRAAKAHWHAEALHRTDGDVGAELCRRVRQRKRKRIGDEDNQRAGGASLLDRRLVVAIDAEGVRPGDEQGGRVVVDRLAVDLDAERLGAGAHDIQRLWMRRSGERHLGALVAVVAKRDADGFGDRGRLIEQRGRCHRQAGQFGDQGLEIEQHFQPALADLGLIGGVGRIPGRILEQIALDDRRYVDAMIAGADEALQHSIPSHGLRQFGQRFGFTIPHPGTILSMTILKDGQTLLQREATHRADREPRDVRHYKGSTASPTRMRPGPTTSP